MNIIFLSNYFTHHQKPFSDEMYQLLGNNYTFIETEKMSEERKNLGWGMKEYPSYVVSLNMLNNDYKWYQKRILDAEIVITGSAPESIVMERKRKGKIILRYSERPLKTGNSTWKYPARLLKWHLKNPMWKPIYMLCASAYTAADYANFGLFKGKCFKWGYFTECKKYAKVEDLILNKKPFSILWVGRFIKLKHPDASIEVAKRLKQNGYSFHLNLIGNGDLQAELEQKIMQEKLEDCVTIYGSMKPEQVRIYMEQSEIFLFTSDRNEGWGAVLNESMNSACVVVASHAIGSVPFLLEEGVNGKIYKDGSLDELYANTVWLLEHQVERREMAKKAYETICEKWSPEVAAKRIIKLSESLLTGQNENPLFDQGPCSKAVIVSDDWIEK